MARGEAPFFPTTTMPPTTGSSSSAPVDQVLAQNAPSPAKRKRASKEADATPAAGNGASAQKRPVKRRKGKLARLPEMPLEVLFEVCGLALVSRFC
jgi:hypothetical protein